MSATRRWRSSSSTSQVGAGQRQGKGKGRGGDREGDPPWCMCARWRICMFPFAFIRVLCAHVRVSVCVRTLRAHYCVQRDARALARARVSVVAGCVHRYVCARAGPVLALARDQRHEVRCAAVAPRAREHARTQTLTHTHTHTHQRKMKACLHFSVHWNRMVPNSPTLSSSRCMVREHAVRLARVGRDHDACGYLCAVRLGQLSTGGCVRKRGHLAANPTARNALRVRAYTETAVFRSVPMQVDRTEFAR